MPIRIDTQAWPVVMHRSSGQPTDTEIDAYVTQATAVLERGEPHANIIDARGISEVSPYARAAKKAWLEDHLELLARHCVCTAVVLDGAITRFVMATILLVQPFPIPYRVFGTVEAAQAWVHQQLAALEEQQAPVVVPALQRR